MNRILVLSVLAALAASVGEAAATLPHVFGDHMVLQRGQRVPVWGKADPGEKVTVSFAGQSVTATAGEDGRWKLFLAPLEASSDPQAFVVAHAGGSTSFADVVVGEVWFCSGQSNMEYTMSSRRKVKDWERECAAANDRFLRHFNVASRTAAVPQDDVTATWVDTTPQTIPPQSAVAYMFGETLRKELKVPVGLINCSWGGTRIEPWTPAGHADDLYLLQHLAKWNRPQDVPTVLWNGMVAGLCPFAIKGAIWYQGCANRADGNAYLDKTVSLVRGWRREWGQGDFPYFLVQLAPYKYDNVKGTVLAVLQEAQARVPEKVPNSGYTVINDVGDVNDIHPTDKRTVGIRMADQVLDRVYGTFVRPWKTPVLKGGKAEGRSFRVTFENADGLRTRDGKAPTEFELCDICGVWQPAEAKIEGCDVVLTAKGVDAPLAMRFAAYNGSTPNLVNGHGLPAGPCRCGVNPGIGAAEKLPELKGFTCVQRYDIPVNCDMSRKVPKALASVEDVRRVAYLLELQKPDGEVQFVLTAMDAFAPSSASLILTEKPGARLYRLPVSHLTVRSNVSAVKPQTDAEGGFLEFYNCNYSAKAQPRPAGGDDRRHDFNDTPLKQPTLGYGCLQVHDLKSKTTVMAFNHFNAAAVPCDVGIGPSSGEHPDWTFARNAGSYKARRISVWVK